jgi:1,2-diacylglycerol 3-alpha-glucosyltransferase
MRIVFFTDYYLPHIGGVETSLYNQQRALKAAGHEVFIVTMPMRGSGHVDDDKEGVVRLPQRMRLWYDGMQLYLWPRKSHFKLIDRLEPEIIHYQTQERISILAIKYGKSRRLPLIYTAHTFCTPQISLLLPAPRTAALIADISQRFHLRKLYPNLKIKPANGLYGIPCNTSADRRILKVWMKYAALADVVVAPSQRMIDYVNHYLPKPPKYVIPNPFASPEMQVKPPTPVHQPIRIISSFVLRPEKRPQVLIEAYRLLSPEERQKIKIDMYGGGLWLNKMKALVKKYGLQNEITIHGSVPTHELHQAKLNSDVMVSTSYGFDNQPMMFLEALAAGCVILFCDPYLNEGTDADNSVLVDPSPEGFAQGLRAIINKRNLNILITRASLKSTIGCLKTLLNSQPRLRRRS